MRTAIDTNVLSALWSKELSTSDLQEILVMRRRREVVVSGPVFADLLAYPKATESFVNDFLADTGIAVDFEFQQLVWVEAGRRFAHYAKRRRRSGHQGPRCLLADFVIGSHALAQADRFMTLDPKRYERDFPELKLI
jgi:predicted nucleic acid-binding protein